MAARRSRRASYTDEPIPRARHGQLVFWYGTMSAGKSTLALQVIHNRTSRGVRGLVFVRHDRGGAQISSRIAPAQPAAVVADDTDLHAEVRRAWRDGPVEFVVCDEAQFLGSDHVDQLARCADELDVEVLCFGLLTDFRGELFPASARLMALADRREELQADARCWCGARATMNARLVDGVMVVEGEQVIVGDLDGAEGPTPEVTYDVLCRRHWREGRTG